ncbi:YMGG-like glycine zipper-containing protein [Starkeya koreensis]|uniref:YMGG-like glycine zipper-containing protein n=1 Tax=Ancylobacter koreensis TaxID=266121 RepID=A0ABT0DNE4_9HYPH|nr:YMGG-like glycine zipper-containing protein [Ancylobacter koreensis]MCK0208719.1 YMGG-like glycine zipper-containing protein [Ancylobacter koreensis]
MTKSVAIKLSAVAIVALVAAGCTTTERRAGTGALIGAGTGAVIGGIAGGGTGAAWGAGIGAVAGGAIGAATAK